MTVALLVAVGAAETGRETLMFLTKGAVRLATAGVAIGVACDGCPSLQELRERFRAAGGSLLVCPICFNSRKSSGVDSRRECPSGWHNPPLGVDRRRRHNVQLLTSTNTTEFDDDRITGAR